MPATSTMDQSLVLALLVEKELNLSRGKFDAANYKPIIG